MIRIVAALSCVSVLAGCAFFNSVRENYESRQVLELIGYAQKIAALEAGEQRRERKAARRVRSQGRGACAPGPLPLPVARSGAGGQAHMPAPGGPGARAR